MRLNTLKPAAGSKPDAKRLGRGIGSGLGKTSGRGHKGQHARAGGFHKVGFEGGQMPLQRRVPKFGFSTQSSLVADEVRVGELNKITGDTVDLEALKAARIVGRNVEQVKIFGTGELSRAVTVRGIRVSRGARAAIEAAGGKVES